MGGKWRMPMSEEGRRNVREGIRRYWANKKAQTSIVKTEAVVELNERDIIHLLRKGVLKVVLA